MPEEVCHRNDGVISDVVHGTMTLCDTNKATFFTMNNTGAAIWELCEGRTVDKIVAEIFARFPDAHDHDVAKLVREYVELLEKEELLHRSAAKPARSDRRHRV